MISLAEALDRLVAALRPHIDGDCDWLQSIITLVGDVRDLLEADAHLSRDDLHDVCMETKSLFNLEPHLAPVCRFLIAERPDLQPAYAKCLQEVEKVCGQINDAVMLRCDQPPT